MARCAALLVLAACGGGSTASPEVVVDDARLGGAAPNVIGATASTVSWTASGGTGTTLVGGAPLATLPVAGQQLAISSGPVTSAGDLVGLVAEHSISRVGLDGLVQRIEPGDPDALGASGDAEPVIVWTAAAMVSWGVTDLQMTTTLSRIDRCDHVRVTAQQIYVAADGASGRRLLRIDERTGVVTPITSSSAWATMFPGGAVDTATYVGRVVAADDDGALWLVEEKPSGRGILVSEPVQGDASVLLEHLAGASGFFASATALYWQEGDALLTAPRAGGAASIVASLPGAAGALADGFIYFVNGNSIERLRVE